ncbi:hypothetical protein HDU98_004367, partial [Podochytrium sp. JEL0797]
MYSETTDDHLWMWTKIFEAHDGVKPTVLITDEDPAVVAVMALPEFASIIHLLCIYHLGMLNIPKILGPLLRGGDYQPIMSLWWAARNSTTEKAFGFCWEELLECVNAAGCTAEAKEKVKHYLARLYGTQKKWCLTWVNTRFTMRSHTSGRVEKYQDLIKRGLCGTLTDFIKQ